jgi:hypothetical protein
MRRKTYDLGNGIYKWFARFVVCFKPENKRSEWLASKGLHCCEAKLGHHHVKGHKGHTEDKSEEKGFPAREVTENSFDGVRLAFRNPANY